MKKIVEIKSIGFNKVADYIKEGWDLYGVPCMTIGENAIPMQTIVKYSDEEIGGNIVETIMLKDSATTDDDGYRSYPDICKKANEYIKNGYQPYGTVMSIHKLKYGTNYVDEYLAMVKYE